MKIKLRIGMMKSIQREVTTTMRTLVYFLVITDMNDENQNLDKSNQGPLKVLHHMFFLKIKQIFRSQVSLI